MDANSLLGLMRSYFEGKQPPEVLETLSEQSPRALLKESLDIVEFICFLEDELQRDFDLAKLGSLLNKNFGELAVEVSGQLD